MSTPVLSDVPSLIAAHMRAAAARNPGGKAGPFTIGLDEHSGHPMRNFAVLDDGAAPSAADISALVAFFRGHDRIPRLEFIEASAPAVTPALLAAGFTAEARTPVMACVPGMTLTPRDLPASPCARPPATLTWRPPSASSTTPTPNPRPARRTSPGSGP